MIKLWILKILDGFFTLIGEIVIFFGIYAGADSMIKLLGTGLFLVLLGQFAGINAIRYDNKKKLALLMTMSLETVGQNFAYPVLLFVLYVLAGGKIILALAFALALVAFVKSAVILYKAKLIEGMTQ